MRGIFFEEQAVRKVERQLRSEGFEVSVSRERFAGEDDDEDHPWALVTDAPGVVLELLVDLHDGWLDDDLPPQRSAAAPEPLPSAPRRLHRDPEEND